MAVHLRESGNVATAAQVARQIRVDDYSDEAYRRDWLVFLAWVRTHRAGLGSIDLLDQLRTKYGEPLWLINEYLSAYRFRTLLPAPQATEWLDRGLRRRQESIRTDPKLVHQLDEHHAAILLVNGEAARASEVLRAADTALQLDRRCHQLRARLLALLAEALRRLGDIEEARFQAEMATNSQAIFGFMGDLPFSLGCLAKASKDDPCQAYELLIQATDTYERFGNAGVVRSLLLKNRLARAAARECDERDYIVWLVKKLPSYRRCPLVARILKNWDNWTDGKFQPDATGDAFWGV